MMILLDPDLEPDSSPPKDRTFRGGPGPMPRRKADAPMHRWGRARLPWPERLPTPQTLARFLAEAQDEAGLSGEVTVLLTTDATIRDLNRRFRGHDKPTDVLSFPANTLVQNEEKGDLAISVETARRQAAEQGHALTCELKILMLHGLLHLAGYDHAADEGRMARRERVLRGRLGLPAGLIERSSLPTLSQRTRKNGARITNEPANSQAGKRSRSGKP